MRIMYYNVLKQKKGCGEMWRYKIDILKELSNRGYTSTKMRKDKIMSEGTMQHIRKGHGIS